MARQWIDRPEGRLALWSRCALLGFMAGVSGVSGCATFRPKAEVYESQISLARLSERHGQAEQATRIYGAILDKDPSNQVAHHRLGVIAARSGRLADAEGHFARAISAGGANPDLLSDVGYNLYLQHRLPEAEQQLRAALALDGNHKAARNNLALVLGDQGNMDASYAEFRRAADEAQARANLAYTQAQYGDLAAAEQTYHRALGMNGDLRSSAQALLQLNSYGPGPQAPPGAQPGAPLAGPPGPRGHQPYGPNPYAPNVPPHDNFLEEIGPRSGGPQNGPQYGPQISQQYQAPPRGAPPAAYNDPSFAPQGPNQHGGYGPAYGPVEQVGYQQPVPPGAPDARFHDPRIPAPGAQPGPVPRTNALGKPLTPEERTRLAQQAAADRRPPPTRPLRREEIRANEMRANEMASQQGAPHHHAENAGRDNGPPGPSTQWGTAPQGVSWNAPPSFTPTGPSGANWPAGPNGPTGFAAQPQPPTRPQAPPPNRAYPPAPPNNYGPGYPPPAGPSGWPAVQPPPLTR